MVKTNPNLTWVNISKVWITIVLVSCQEITQLVHRRTVVSRVIVYVPAVGCLSQIMLMYRGGPEGNKKVPHTNKGYAAKADQFMQLVQIRLALEYSLSHVNMPGDDPVDQARLLHSSGPAPSQGSHWRIYSSKSHLHFFRTLSDISWSPCLYSPWVLVLHLYSQFFMLLRNSTSQISRVTSSSTCRTA